MTQRDLQRVCSGKIQRETLRSEVAKWQEHFKGQSVKL